jgi:NADPH:quinone reductase-like Zn-dependent oxidoreductase
MRFLTFSLTESFPPKNACRQSHGQGVLANYTTVAPDWVVRKPSAVTFTDAAGIGLAGKTAWVGLVGIGQLHEGQRVLIYGGSGGVGCLAVQIAKARGAWVTSTCSPSSRELVQRLGADEVRLIYFRCV